MAFENATRRKIVSLPAQARPVGGGTISFTLPRTGLLARVFLLIRGNVSGSLSEPNALGMASIVNRVRLTANSGIDVVNVSGPGYHYLFRDMQELEYDVSPQSNARAAVTAAAFNLDMILPIQINQRDSLGLMMLQSEQTLLTLSLDFLADASVATGATVTATVTPFLELFTVPTNVEDWPPLNVIHSLIEEAQAIPAAGEFTYNWPRGHTYLQLMHGAGIGVPGADNFTRVQVRFNQSDYLMDVSPEFLDVERAFSSLVTRRPGVINLDFMGSAGLGMYDKMRDTINSALVTDLATVITASGAGTFYSMRRQLIMLS